jgi:hypothetical protein
MDSAGRSATAQVVVVVSELGVAADAASPAQLGSSAPQLEPTERHDTEAANPAPSGGGPEQGSGNASPHDVSADHASVDNVFPDETLDESTAEPPIDDSDDAVERLVAEAERQRVYDARPWAPPGQYEITLAGDQVVADMTERLIALAESASMDDVSRSLAVFDETFDEFLDGVRRGDRQVGQAVVGSSIAFSAGIVAWLLRGGALAASLFSVLPAWMSFDPVPILVGRRGGPVPTPARPSDDSSEAAVARVLRPGTRHQPSDQG